VEKKTKTRNLR